MESRWDSCRSGWHSGEFEKTPRGVSLGCGLGTANPERIESLSPGLPRSRYPGKALTAAPTLKELNQT